MPQIVVYKPSFKRSRDMIAHWLSPDGTTFCGRDPKRNIGWEPYDGSPYRLCGRCMRSARGVAPKSKGGSGRGQVVLS